MKVTRVSDPCGDAVPFFDYREDPSTLDQRAESKRPAKLKEYRQRKNAQNIDGLPGLDL